MPTCPRCGAPLAEIANRCPRCGATVAARRQQSITPWLVGINVAVFALMALKGVSPLHPDANQARDWGANFGPLSLGTEPWRLITANFIHFGIFHLAINMLVLNGLGRLVEVFFTKLEVVTLYLVTGVAGGLLSVYAHPLTIGAGASTAIFGIAGALLTLLRWGNLTLDAEQRRRLYRDVVRFAGVNLIAGFMLSFFINVDNFAHTGGLVAGGIAGVVIGRARSWPARRLAWVGLGAAVVVTFFGVARLREPETRLHFAQAELRAGRTERAIAMLLHYSSERPDDPRGHFLRGQAFTAAKDHLNAARAFERALDRAPNSTEAILALISAYQAADRWPQAEVMARRLVEQNRQDAGRHYLLATVLLRQEKFDEGEQQMQEAIKLAPQRAEYRAALGSLYLQRGRSKEAVTALEEARRLSPNNPAVLRVLANAYTANGELTKAAEIAALIAHLAPGKTR